MFLLWGRDRPLKRKLWMLELSFLLLLQRCYNAVFKTFHSDSSIVSLTVLAKLGKYVSITRCRF